MYRRNRRMQRAVPRRAEKNQMEESMRVEGEDSSSLVESMRVEEYSLVERYTEYNYTELKKKEERWNKTTIYRVPEHILNMTYYCSAYQPQWVKLGHFHGGNTYHERGHKDRASLHLVKRADKPMGVFVTAVEDVADQLAAAYGLDPITDVTRKDFVDRMVTDGCFLLELMRMIELEGEVPDYAPNDPVFSKHGYLYLKNVILADMFVMENQMPMLLLETLAGHVPTPSERCQDVGDMIKNMVVDFFGLPVDNSYHLDGDSLHPIDIARKILCGESERYADERRIRIPRDESEGYANEWRERKDTMPSALELYEAGIHFKAIRSRSLDINFQGGVLSMPVLRVNNYALTVFINLMTFEQLHPGAGNGVTEYLIFMDHIIDSAKDVALLRSKGVLDCALGSDEEVANLFNTLSKGAVMDPSNKLQKVRLNVNAYCRKTWPKWRASLIHTYFRNPWVFISLVAAAVLLVATLLQTIFTIKP